MNSSLTTNWADSTSSSSSLPSSGSSIRSKKTKQMVPQPKTPRPKNKPKKLKAPSKTNKTPPPSSSLPSQRISPTLEETEMEETYSLGSSWKKLDNQQIQTQIDQAVKAIVKGHDLNPDLIQALPNLHLPKPQQEDVKFLTGKDVTLDEIDQWCTQGGGEGEEESWTLNIKLSRFNIKGKQILLSQDKFMSSSTEVIAHLQQIIKALQEESLQKKPAGSSRA